VRERQRDLDAAVDCGAVRLRELQQLRPKPLGVRDISELSEALLALAKLLEQRIDDYLRRGRNLKQRSLHLGGDRDHDGVSERDELLVVPERRKERAR